MRIDEIGEIYIYAKYQGWGVATLSISHRKKDGREKELKYGNFLVAEPFFFKDTLRTDITQHIQE